MKRDLVQTLARVTPRAVHGIAAVLLPYTPAGGIDWDGFERHVARTHEAGLACAVNMDTGFGDLLSVEERRDVLAATRRALGDGVRFYAGAYTRKDDDGPLAGYREAIADIDACGAMPVIVQCLAMHGMTPAEKAELYARVVGIASEGALAFELSPRFAPHGEIWDEETFERLLQIEGLLGAKHSSLDRGVEFTRLEQRDRQRPEFRVYTGNDLAIDMVAYGSDYLLGLATFAPERFAERDRLFEAGDGDVLMKNDALQHMGNVGFRTPIPAYKHSAAQFLHLCGMLAGDDIHPDAPRRPGSERILLLDCAIRLDLVDDREKAWNEHVVPHVEGT